MVLRLHHNLSFIFNKYETMYEDIVCYLDEEERKIILFDDFGCWDEGCYMGQNTPEVLAQMPKSN